MRRIDDFLIDRVFQSLSDAVAEWVSCYGIAAFLLTGAGLCFVAVDIHFQQWVALLVAGPWIALMTSRAYQLDREAPRNVLPTNRLTSFWLRSFNLLMLPIDAAQLLLSRDVWGVIDHSTWIFATAAFYFMACRRLPPSQRRVSMPLAGAFARGRS